MTDPDDNARDLHLRDDGTIIIRTKVDDVTTVHRLRRPIIGELRTLAEGNEAIGHEVLRRASRRKAIEQEIVEATGALNDDPSDENVAALAALQIERASTRVLDDLVATWMRDAMVMLSDFPDDVPEIEYLPAFLVAQPLVIEMLGHWRSVPLARGA